MMAERFPTPPFRFQFRLRTLLIFVTLAAAICGYLAREHEIVRQRKSVIDVPQNFYVFESPVRHYICFPSDDNTGVSWVRQILGDQAISQIAIPIGTSKVERDQVVSLFPEAKIRAYRPPYSFDGSHFKGEFLQFPDEELKIQP